VGKGESRWLINVLSWILAWSFEWFQISFCLYMSSVSMFTGCLIILLASLMTDDICGCVLSLLFCKIQYHVWSWWNVQLLVIVQQEEGTLYDQSNVLVERGFILLTYVILHSPEEDEWVVMG
jgi:hypothetical protein